MPNRDPSVWSGRATVVDGVLEAELTCPWQSVTKIRGTPAPGGWSLVVSEVVYPPDMQVPWLDDPKGQG